MSYKHKEVGMSVGIGIDIGKQAPPLPPGSSRQTRKQAEAAGKEFEASLAADHAHFATSADNQIIALSDAMEGGIVRLARLIKDWMNHQGFEITNFGESIALCHSELTEALEARRLPDSAAKDPERSEAWELADTVIRILHLVAHEGIEDEFAHALFAKMQKNLKRPYRHGKKF